MNGSSVSAELADDVPERCTSPPKRRSHRVRELVFAYRPLSSGRPGTWLVLFAGTIAGVLTTLVAVLAVLMLVQGRFSQRELIVRSQEIRRL